MDEHFAEQFPLSPADDYMIHQTPDPIRVMWSSDPRAYDRYWTVFHDDAGEIIVATGGSFYPNLDLAESYAIVNYRGDHDRCARSAGSARIAWLWCGPIRTTMTGHATLAVPAPPTTNGASPSTFTSTTRHGRSNREPAGSKRGMPPGRRPDVTPA